MSIFLHFLNREAYRAVNASYDIGSANKLLRTLAVATEEDLYTNFSNLIEGSLLSSNEETLAMRLLKYDQLLVEGERSSVGEFVESRAERYAYDSDRYPMYFESPPEMDVKLTRVRANSITGYLADEVSRIGRGEKTLVNIGLKSRDETAIQKASERVGRVLKERDAQGITRSLFSGKLPSQQSEAAVARLLSSLYIKKYIDELACDIATGITGLVDFDHLGTGVWSHNYPVILRILRALGLAEELGRSSATLDEHIATQRGSKGQALFCSSVRNLCEVASRIDENRLVRPAARMQELLASADLKRVAVLAERFSYDEANANLGVGIGKLRKNYPAFAFAYEGRLMESATLRTVLLVTATTAESLALRDVAKEYLSGPLHYLSQKAYIAAELGVLGNQRIVHVQCEAGSVGASNSQAVISDAIKDFRPIAVIMGGIAFGSGNKKQKLGDVLVSKHIVEYEKAKMNRGERTPRGQKIECPPKMLSVFRELEAQKLVNNLHFGPMLSGEKLINSAAFLNSLLDQEPEAIGGEMEGAGLVAAASRAKVDWIVVKAIVDWGKRKDKNNTPEHQENIARSAFSAIFTALDKIGL